MFLAQDTNINYCILIVDSIIYLACLAPYVVLAPYMVPVNYIYSNVWHYVTDRQPNWSDYI